MNKKLTSKSTAAGSKKSRPISRRKFLAATAASVGGAATLGFPMISRAETITVKMQGAWSSTDIFNEFAMEFVNRVNAMAGGRLRIDYLIAGAVEKPFEVTDAVSKGVLDAGHTVPVYWYGKSKVASLFGSGPINGCDAHQTLAWIYRGGGLDLYKELLRKLGLNYVGFFAMPMPTQPLGWFKKPITDAKQLKGLKYRTVGLAADLFQEMGAKVTQLPGGEIVPAMDRGLLDAAEFNNASSDRLLGFADVSKVFMLQSYHQSGEQFEITFNKTKFDALPVKMKAIIENAVEAASQDLQWKSIDRYSQDYIELQTKDKVRVYITPAAILQKQLDIFDGVMEKYSATNPLFKEVLESQRKFAARSVKWGLDTIVNPRMAYNYYFGKRKAAKKA